MDSEMSEELIRKFKKYIETDKKMDTNFSYTKTTTTFSPAKKFKTSGDMFFWVDRQTIELVEQVNHEDFKLYTDYGNGKYIKVVSSIEEIDEFWNRQVSSETGDLPKGFGGFD